ncbi:MAG: FixH family protein [Crocinitomicaceae bacterium]|nr:FixH family protein [Crocinitomicaceae bacterium]
MNWGKSLVLVMVLFITFIMVMVVKMISTSPDLVSDDYYQKEIDYEQEIVAVKNMRRLNASTRIETVDGFLVFHLPLDIPFTKMEIDLIRPNNQKLDKSFVVTDTKVFMVPFSELEKGKYSIEMTFKVDSIPCMQKDTITI